MTQLPSFPRMHVSLYVTDIDKTVQFYDQFFDQPASKQMPKYAKYILEAPRLIISFVERPDRVQPNFGHLGFQVETKEILAAHHSRIKTTGLATLEEKGTNCCYALQDKYWVSDPDGHRWEVYYFHEDVEWNDPAYNLEKANHENHALDQFQAQEISKAGTAGTQGMTCC
ncbi:MAG: ArsI/CadI family heavy metal resistance metalloenzyme [Bacteroidota bacterium]